MRSWWPLVAICLGTFMLLVDVTFVNVALPAIAASLGTSFSALQWVIDGYALALAALLMVTGTLADRFGRRRVYLVGLGVFAVVLAGLRARAVRGRARRRPGRAGLRRRGDVRDDRSPDRDDLRGSRTAGPPSASGARSTASPQRAGRCSGACSPRPGAGGRSSW